MSSNMLPSSTTYFLLTSCPNSLAKSRTSWKLFLFQNLKMFDVIRTENVTSRSEIFLHKFWNEKCSCTWKLLYLWGAIISNFVWVSICSTEIFCYADPWINIKVNYVIRYEFISIKFKKFQIFTCQKVYKLPRMSKFFNFSSSFFNFSILVQFLLTPHFHA